MENIIFCGGCGTFISANEISTGKASKVNNIYYCLKCSTGTQAAPVRQASVPQASRPGGSAPAAPAAGQPQVKRPVPQPATIVPSQARPVSPTARPVQQAPGQRPPTAKPAVQQPPVPAGQSRQSVPTSRQATPARPIAALAKGVAKPVSLHQTQKVAPPQPPARSGQTSRIRVEEFEELDAPSLRRFGKAKGGIKKIYLIAGAAAVVVVITILIITSMSNAAKEKAEADRQKTLQGYFREIEEAEKDYPNEPQKVIDQIKKRAESLKGTNYETKVAEKEQAANARIEIMGKIKELEKPVDTAKEIDKRLKEISVLKSNPAVNKPLEDKLNELMTLFKNQRKKIAEDEKKSREEQEAAEKKAYEDFKAKIESHRSKKEWKEMLRECDILLGRPNGLQYQEEVDKIKAEAKEALEEQQAKVKKRKEWQVLNDDISKWDRSGDSKSEIYIDDDKIMLKNPNSSSNPGAVTSINNNNNGENWKDFTLTVEFKVLSGSFDMLLRGGLQPINIPGFGPINIVRGIPIPFPRIFKTEWQKYTIEVKGKKLTISGTGLPKPITTDVSEAAGGIGINVNGGDNIIVKELKAKVIE